MDNTQFPFGARARADNLNRAVWAAAIFTASSVVIFIRVDTAIVCLTNVAAQVTVGRAPIRQKWSILLCGRGRKGLQFQAFDDVARKPQNPEW